MFLEKLSCHLLFVFFMTFLLSSWIGPPVVVVAFEAKLPIHLQVHQQYTISSSTTHFMISNLFNNGGGGNLKNQLPTLPKDVKEAVSKCRQSTQEALQKRISRMDIEFPVGTQFNIEKQKTNNNNKKTKSKKSQGKNNNNNNTPTLQDFQRSNRELARLFVEMFQPVGSENIAVIFQDDEQSNIAKDVWKDNDYSTTTASARILSFHRTNKKKNNNNSRTTKAKGFAAKLAAELDDTEDNPSGPFTLPDNIEVALFVSPGPKELVAIEKICNQVGMGTLVILLNCRLSTISNFGSAAAKDLFTNQFETVFHLAAAPQDVAPNCLLYRSYPNDWILARKRPAGPPKSIGSWPNKPTSEECSTIFETIDLSDVEKGVDTIVENVASWLK